MPHLYFLHIFYEENKDNKLKQATVTFIYKLRYLPKKRIAKYKKLTGAFINGSSSIKKEKGKKTKY